jgi:hypothetical protein
MMKIARILFFYINGKDAINRLSTIQKKWQT